MAQIIFNMELAGGENPDEPGGSCSEINRIRCFVKQDDLFIPGACTECHKIPSEKVTMRACSNCRLAFYCGKMCQKNNWTAHKVFCKALSSTTEDLIHHPGAHALVGAKYVLPSGISYSNYLVMIIKKVSEKLNRDLDKLEGKMISLAKVCEICKEANPRKLDPCKMCFMSFYCSEDHASQDLERHKKFCSEYFLALHCYHLAMTKGIPIPGAIPFSIPVASKYKPLSGTLKDYIRPTFDPQIDACMSDYVSYPFSILFALQNTGLNRLSHKVSEVKELTILMLDTYCCMFRNAETNLTWEYLFHFLPKLKKLDIVIHEPTEKITTYCDNDVELCAECMSRKCKLNVTAISDYRMYRFSDMYRAPDVIFNHEVADHDGTISDLISPDPKVPVFLINTNKEILTKNLNMVKEWKKEKFRIILPLQVNPFRGQQPRKVVMDYLEDGSYIQYVNAYIVGFRRQTLGKSFASS